MTPFHIALARVTVRVGPDRRILFQVPSLKISSGERVLVKGASGQGKTTFLHLLAGLFTPDKGKVLVGDRRLDTLDEEARCRFRRKHVGIVFQKLNLIEHLTALENVEVALPRGETRQRAMEALESVGLRGREQDRVSVMSMGEQQRVGIARVLAGRFPLVFADEPTSSLDEANALAVMGLLMDACSGKTLVVVSHDRRIEGFFTRTIDFGDFASP